MNRSRTIVVLLAAAARLSQCWARSEDFPAPAAEGAKEVAKFKKMDLEELMNQKVTSVAKQPESYGQAPAAIQVITGDEIRRSGVSSIPEALRLADALQVAQVTSSSWAISARGFNASVGNKLLVLIDGRSVYSPLFSGVIWNMQDCLLEDVDRIEVISGPGGSLWGANAVNGVINITTKSANETQGLYTEVGGGSLLRDSTAIRYGGTLSSNVFYRVYGKYFENGPLVYRGGQSAHDSWNRGQGGFRIDGGSEELNQITFQGDLFGGDSSVVPGGQGTPRAQGSTSGGNVLGRWTHTISDESDTHLQLYYYRTHLNAPFQSNGTIPAGALLEDLDTYDLDFQHRFPIGERNHIVWGLGYRFTNDRIEDAPLVSFSPNDLDQNLFSCFIQDELKLVENVFLTVGSKLEHNDYVGFEFEPSARLQWNITDKHMVWAAVSRAARTPSRYDRDLLEPSPAYGVFLGSRQSNFQSESLVAYEVGYRAHLGRKVSTTVSLFYHDYDSLRSLNFIDGQHLPLVFENNLRGETYGFEASINYQVLEWWRLHGGYDLLKEDIRVKPGAVDLFQALNETADPEQQFFLPSSMNLPYRLELDIAARWIDTIHNNMGAVAGTVASYAEADARLAWQATKTVEVAVVGQNLLDDRHPEHGFPGIAQEEVVRSVYGKITWRY